MNENTQEILEGLSDLPPVDPSQFDVNQILAEYGSAPVSDAAPQETPPAAPEDNPFALPEEPRPDLSETNQFAHLVRELPDRPNPGLGVLPEEDETEPPAEKTPKILSLPHLKFPRVKKPAEAPEASEEEAAPLQLELELPAAPEPEPAIAMEDIVAGTVGAVLEEQEEARQQAARRMKRQQKKLDTSYRTKTKAPAQEEEFQQEEPSLAEATVRMKRLLRRLNPLCISAAVLTLLFWLLALLPGYGVRIPYYADYSQAPLIAALVLQIAASGCAWPVFARAGRELFRQKQVGWATAVCLADLVSLLDTATAPFLAGRCAGQSLGGISMAALTLALFSLRSEAAACRETFRLAALGRPSYVVDTGPSGAVKGPGSAQSFYSRTVSEDAASAWQRVLLPVLLTAELVFALLSSVGLDRGQDFLWCWSAILTAGTALSLPLVYSLPFARLAARLNKCGGAVAGSYGATQLSRCREIILTDIDLFPPGSVTMLGKKVIAEDRRKVAAYAGSLAEELGACYAPLMQAFMQEEGATRMPLVHFHVHEDGGASASIKGETAVLGSAFTLRKQAVRLPRALEQKEGLYLAIDGELSAIFALEYSPREGVEWALHAMKRNGITPLLSLRDGGLSAKFLRQKFGSDGGAILLDAAAKSSLAQPGRSLDPKPNGLLYREGLAPFFEVVAGGKRLARIVRIGNLISLAGSVLGALLGYYLAFSGAVTLLTPTLLMGFLLLWLLPALILGWSADHI